MFVALTSMSAAPGVSTTALGLALSAAADRVLYVEADPFGGSFLHSGYFGSLIPQEKSIVGLVDATRRGRLAQEIGDHAIAIPGTSVWAVPGLWTGAQADSMGSTWGTLGAYLAGMSRSGVSVVVDLGRFGHRAGPAELMAHADMVAVVTRPMLSSLTVLRGGLPQLRKTLAANRSQAVVGVIQIGSRYPAREVAGTLGVDVPVTIPDSPRHARIFSDGASLTRLARTRSMYLRSLRHAWPQLCDYAGARHGIMPVPQPDSSLSSVSRAS